jgi:hypothetical protein
MSAPCPQRQCGHEKPREREPAGQLTSSSQNVARLARREAPVLIASVAPHAVLGCGDAQHHRGKREGSATSNRRRCGSGTGCTKPAFLRHAASPQGPLFSHPVSRGDRADRGDSRRAASRPRRRSAARRIVLARDRARCCSDHRGSRAAARRDRLREIGRRSTTTSAAGKKETPPVARRGK